MVSASPIGWWTACRPPCRRRRIFLSWESSPWRFIAVLTKRPPSSSRRTPNAESSPSGRSRAPDHPPLPSRPPRRGAAGLQWQRAKRGSARGPLQRRGRRAGHRLRDGGFPVPRVPDVRRDGAPHDRAGIRADRQGTLGIHQSAADEYSSQRRCRGGSRDVRGAAGTLLAHARCALPAAGHVGQARIAAQHARDDRAARRCRPREAARLSRRGQRTQGSRAGRAACRAIRGSRHPFLLYRRRPARRRALHARPDAALVGLDLHRAHARIQVSKPSFLYRLSVNVATRAAPLVARFDKKVARGLDGRRGLAARLAAWAATRRDTRRPLVWMHAPSVGEGLQAKPVLETLRAEHPDWQLAFTFFSPSAERLAKNLPVDVADYLPLDRPSEVAAVLDALKPTALVFSKLDVWPELTLAAARRGVKLGLISATVSPHSSRLRWPTRQWSAPAYRALDRVGTISEEDGERLELLGARADAIAVTGDTRYDSVAERAARLDKTREPLARLATTATGTFTIVAGSTWPSDEAVLLPAFADLLHQLPTARLLLAPHEPNPDHLAGIAERLRHLKLPRPVRLSQLEHAKPGPVIVVDRVGILADLYSLGDTAFVGGGFHRAGLHSVLEPAVFGVPLIFGPHWRMSRDAALLLDQGGAVAMPPPGDARHPLHSQWLVWHHDPEARTRVGKAAKQVVADGRGASERTAALVWGLVEG